MSDKNFSDMTDDEVRALAGAAAPYDVHAKLDDPMGVLAIALAQWEDSDDTRPQPRVRQAANTAMDAIDGMLRDLHAIRARLVGEIFESDDATMVRAEALLERARERARKIPGEGGTR